MNLFTPSEIVENYSAAGQKKAFLPAVNLLFLGILSGLFIALGAVATNTAAHALSNVSLMRTLLGLLFPGGLILVLLLGGELFTGNCLMIISVLEKKLSVNALVKNWIAVYTGNFLGSVFIAWACASFGQLNYSDGQLAVFTINLAFSKISLSFPRALVLGILCNILVCLAVLASLSAKDTCGKIAALYFPIAFFVISGFEHSVANMYYIPAGIFASAVPEYAAKAAQSNLDLSALTWGNFLISNLLPVTLGNLIGGMAIGILMWAGHRSFRKNG